MNLDDNQFKTLVVIGLYIVVVLLGYVALAGFDVTISA